MEFLIEPITVIGYHGTSRQAAESILTEDFRRSEETWDWLGHGAYFWQDAPVRAYEWARQRGCQDPTVVAARIELSNFVDLLDLQGSKTLWKFATHYKARVKPIHLTNKNGANNLDCAIFNFTTTMLSSVGLKVAGYRAACVEGRKLTAGSPIHDKSHVQIVVLDQRAIKEKWMVKNGEEG